MDPEFEKDIVVVLRGLFGDSRLKYFQLTPHDNIIIVRIDPQMYPSDSSMRENSQYIHVMHAGDSDYGARLWKLNKDIGEKTPISIAFRGGLFEVLKPMAPTILYTVDV